MARAKHFKNPNPAYGHMPDAINEMKLESHARFRLMKELIAGVNLEAFSSVSISFAVGELDVSPNQKRELINEFIDKSIHADQHVSSTIFDMAFGRAETPIPDETLLIWRIISLNERVAYEHVKKHMFEDLLKVLEYRRSKAMPIVNEVQLKAYATRRIEELKI